MTPPAGPEEVREPDFEAALRWARCRLEFGSPSGENETERDDSLARCYLAMSGQAPGMEAMREALAKARAEIWEHVETWNGLGIIAEIDAALQAAERGKA